jgi:hypothetical protein
MSLFDSGLINTKEIEEIFTWPDGGWEHTIYDDEGNIAEQTNSWESYHQEESK